MSGFLVKKYNYENKTSVGFKVPKLSEAQSIYYLLDYLLYCYN